MNPVIEKYTDIIRRIKRYKPDLWHPKSLTYLRDRLDEITSLTVRIRDDFRCFTCGKTYPEVVLQCGHLIHRSAYPTRWLEDNLHCQCAGCNYTHERKPDIYRRKWEAVHGGHEAYEELVTLSWQSKKITRAERIELFKEWRKKLCSLTRFLHLEGV